MPTSSDDVTIDLGGNPTIQITSGTQAVHSLTSTDSISISGGSLSVAANSSMSGGLTMTGGSLIADGSGITLSVTGTTTVSGGSLEAEGGATLSLSQLTTYAGAVDSTSTLEATGTGSMLSLPKLATVTEDTSSYSSRTQIQALSGGDVELPALTSISGGPVQLESDGAGSTLNINALTSLTGNTGQQLLLRPPGHQSRHGQRQRPGHAQGGEPDARRHRYAFHQPDRDVLRRDTEPERRHGELRRADRRRRLELRGQRRGQ